MDIKDLSWNVYYHNVNSEKIETYNVLKNNTYLMKMVKEYKDKDEFAKALRGEMIYHFWCRCEWELIVEIAEDNHIYLYPWAGCRKPEEARIDVTDNADFDWRGFAELHIGKQIYKNKAKIDVYDQLEYVWDDFLDYVWNSKAHRPRKKDISSKSEM